MVISLIRMSLICTLKWKPHVQGVGSVTERRHLESSRYKIIALIKIFVTQRNH